MLYAADGNCRLGPSMTFSQKRSQKNSARQCHKHDTVAPVHGVNATTLLIPVREMGNYRCIGIMTYSLVCIRSNLIYFLRSPGFMHQGGGAGSSGCATSCLRSEPDDPHGMSRPSGRRRSLR